MTVYGEPSKAELVAKHLELGKEMMAKGQLQDALTHFHAALEGDPNNYLTLYRRATVYLAQGRARAALEDLNRALDISPEFHQARSQKGSILIKLGRLDEAHIELEKVVGVFQHLFISSNIFTHNTNYFFSFSYQ